jgi:hypothetical protein
MGRQNSSRTLDETCSLGRPTTYSGDTCQFPISSKLSPAEAGVALAVIGWRLVSLFYHFNKRIPKMCWKAFSFSVDLHGTHLNQSIHRRKMFYRFPARLWGWGVKIHLFVRRVGCKSKFIVIYAASLNLLYDLNGQGRWMQSARMFTVCCPIY